DHKPDILPDGSFSKWAPIVEGPNHLKGIDVNGDHIPDIAVHGGITVPAPRGAAAIPSPSLPVGLSSSALPPSTASSGVPAGDPTTPPTTLPSAGVTSPAHLARTLLSSNGSLPPLTAPPTRATATGGAPVAGSSAYTSPGMFSGAGGGQPTGRTTRS